MGQLFFYRPKDSIGQVIGSACEEDLFPPGQYLADEITKMESIFEKNGYLCPIVQRVINQTLHPAPSDLLTVGQPQPKAVYIRLPLLGKVSMAFKNRICTTTNNAVPTFKPICCFTSRQMFSTGEKDVLSAEKISDVIYLFTCECGHRYIGKPHNGWRKE